MSFFHFCASKEQNEETGSWILLPTSRKGFLPDPLFWIFLFCILLWIYARYFPAIDLVHDNLSSLSAHPDTYGVYLFFGSFADLFLGIMTLVWWNIQKNSFGGFQKSFWIILLFVGTFLPYIDKSDFVFINDLHVWLIVLALILLIVNWTRIRFQQRDSFLIRSGYRLLLFSIILAFSAFSWCRHISALCQITFIGCYLLGSCTLFGYFSFKQIIRAEYENSDQPLPRKN